MKLLIVFFILGIVCCKDNSDKNMLNINKHETIKRLCNKQIENKFHLKENLKKSDIDSLKTIINNSKSKLDLKAKHRSHSIIKCLLYYNNSEEIIKLLTDNNIPVTQKVSHESIFHLTSRKFLLKPFKYILKNYNYTVLENDRDAKNYNIFHKLILWKNIEGFILLEKFWKTTGNSNAFSKIIYELDNNNMNILELSIKRKDLNMTKYLIQKYENIITKDSLNLALLSMDIELIKFLLQTQKLKLDFKCLDDKYMNFYPMHFAIYNLSTDLFEYLFYKTNAPLYSKSFYKEVCQPIQLLFTKKTQIYNKNIPNILEKRYKNKNERIAGKTISDIILQYTAECKTNNYFNDKNIAYSLIQSFCKENIPLDLKLLIINFINGSFVINGLEYSNEDHKVCMFIEMLQYLKNDL